MSCNQYEAKILLKSVMLYCVSTLSTSLAFNEENKSQEAKKKCRQRSMHQSSKKIFARLLFSNDFATLFFLVRFFMRMFDK